MKQLDRFTSRVWKTIYRFSVEDNTIYSIDVFSKEHAEYLHTVHCSMWVEYYDTPWADWLEQLKDMFWI